MPMSQAKLKNLPQFRGKSDEEIAALAQQMGERRISVTVDGMTVKAEEVQLVRSNGTMIESGEIFTSPCGIWMREKDQGHLVFVPWAAVLAVRFLRGIAGKRR